VTSLTSGKGSQTRECPVAVLRYGHKEKASHAEQVEA